MHCTHYMRREKSGLAFTTLELVQAEEQLGHSVCLREPTDPAGGPGTLLYGTEAPSDVEFIHSQMPVTSYFNGVPKFLWMHGEPLSSVGNGVSMKAIVEMAPKLDASPATLSQLLKYPKVKPGPRLLKALGYRAVTVYQKMSGK